MYLTEWEEFNVSRDHDGLVWNEDLVYGDWNGGPNGDGSFISSMNISVPEVCNLQFEYADTGHFHFYVFVCTMVEFLVHSQCSRMERGTCMSSC